jgi:toxin CcdB
MQCDVHENRQRSRGQVPFLLDVQADLLADLNTRVVVPLVPERSFGRPVSRLHPRFVIAGQPVIMATHLAAAIRRSDVGICVASLADQRDVIVSAVDVLLSGV